MDISIFPGNPGQAKAQSPEDSPKRNGASMEESREESCGGNPKCHPLSRAWIEISVPALEQNVAYLRSRLPESCRLMPAVKAQAYGHGAVLISRQLNRLGVDAFCVACVSEGISLREANIRGEILVLGYTAPDDFPLLDRYGLIQTVTDYPYAQELNRFGKTLRVHIGIDTGMHRLGIRCEEIKEVKKVFEMENLAVEGLFTHLPVSDSPLPRHRDFTRGQIRAFYRLADTLKSQGYPRPKLHILASYGTMNLLRGGGDGCLADSMLAADYVRPGIALYGILSTSQDTDAWQDCLRPVLSLKARVASVRTLYAGESAGYGLAFTAENDMRIATIAIGYADGLPRAVSNGNGSVLIAGCSAPVIGRVCMDQTLIDVSGIPQVQAGDVAVIIGESGREKITVGRLAEQCGTITNEILSRLGPRLERVLTQ